jgi:hypothetical protein
MAEQACRFIILGQGQVGRLVLSREQIEETPE